MTVSLDRFISAQAPVFAQALDELRGGTKRSHWMWFVFPQLAGLGRSATARFYGLADLDEARAYLAHPVLGPRLLAAIAALLGWAGRRSAEAMLGPVDAMKLKSSLTLFEAAGAGADCGEALDAFYGGQRDRLTLDLLNQG